MFDEDLYQESRRRNPMATASVVLGIVSLLFCSFFYFSIPCGALAALFAILSRTGHKLPGKSRIGAVCGLAGIIISCVITVSSVRAVLSNPEMRSYVEQYMQYYLGDPSFSLDEMLNGILPAPGSISNEGDREKETEERVYLRKAQDAPDNSGETELSAGPSIAGENSDSPESDRNDLPPEEPVLDEAVPFDIPDEGGVFL